MEIYIQKKNNVDCVHSEVFSRWYMYCDKNGGYHHTQIQMIATKESLQ
jgi:hypothetical protein